MAPFRCPLLYLILLTFSLLVNVECQLPNINPGDFVPTSFNSAEFTTKPKFNPDNIPAIVKYYAPWIILPVVFGILMSIILIVTTCVSCCCKCCLCHGPLCLKDKIPLIIVFSIMSAIIVGASLSAWAAAPKMATGITLIFNTVSNTVESVKAFAEGIAPQIETLLSDLTYAVVPKIPVADVKSVNASNYAVLQALQDAQNITEELKGLFAQTDVYYGQVRQNLDILKNAENEAPNLPPTSVPLSSQVPETNSSTFVPLILLSTALQTAETESSSFIQSLSALQPDPRNPNLSSITNFSVPFVTDASNLPTFTASDLLGYFGFSNSLDLFNLTSSVPIPFNVSMIEGIKSIVNTNTQYYAMGVSILLAVVIGSFACWYIGIFMASTICLRVPLGISAILILVFGFGVGIHLCFGTLMVDICDQSDDLLLQGTNVIKQQFLNSTNITQILNNTVLRILNEPQKLLSCNGESTIFTIYSIDIIKDFGFQDIIAGFNFSSLLANIPQFNASDSAAIFVPVLEKSELLENMTGMLILENQYNQLRMKAISDDIQNYTSPNASDMQKRDFYGNVAQNLTDLYDGLNTTLTKTKEKVVELRSKLQLLSNLRISIVERLLASVIFPDFSETKILSIFSNLQFTFGKCKFIGDFYDRGLKEALCRQIAPGLVGVGNGTAIVGVIMFVSFPVILWSFKVPKDDDDDDEEME